MIHDLEQTNKFAKLELSIRQNSQQQDSNLSFFIQEYNLVIANLWDNLKK